MKPLQREKFSSLSSPSNREPKPSLKKVTRLLNMTPHSQLVHLVWVFAFLFLCLFYVLNIYLYSNVTFGWLCLETCIFTIEWSCMYFQSHTLDAVLLLLRDLDEEELQVVHTAAQNQLQTFTVDSESFDSLQTEKSVEMQQWNALRRPNVWMICELDFRFCIGVDFGSWPEAPRCEHDWLIFWSQWPRWCPARQKVARL